MAKDTHTSSGSPESGSLHSGNPLVISGPVRVGAHMGPYGPIRALMLVFKSEAFRVQTAPFEKIRIDLWRSPEASTHLRPSGSQKTKA